MAKVLKRNFSKFTEEAVRMAGTTLSLLYALHVSDESEYAAVEEVVKMAQEIRRDMGLPEVDPVVFITGERPKKKEPFGFQVPFRKE